MSWRITKLIIILIAIVFVVRLASQDTLPETIVIRRSAEGRLATQRKLDLSQLTFEDLLLLPKVSDTLAQNMVASKREVLAKGCSLPTSERYRALELVHGIAEKTAKKMDRFIDFRCD